MDFGLLQAFTACMSFASCLGVHLVLQRQYVKDEIVAGEYILNLPLIYPSSVLLQVSTQPRFINGLDSLHRRRNMTLPTERPDTQRQQNLTTM